MPKFDLKTAIFQAVILISTSGFTYHFLSNNVKEKPAVAVIEQKQEEQKEVKQEKVKPIPRGKLLGIFKVSRYHTPKEEYFKRWSNEKRNIKYCDSYIKNKGGFFEAVKCEGYGVTIDGKLCSYKNIRYYKERSKCTENPENSKGYTSLGRELKEHETVAVDPRHIKLGSIVRLEFYNKDKTPCLTELCQDWNNIYIATDTGSRVKGKEIDLFTGFGSDTTSYGPMDAAYDLPRRAKVYLISTPSKEDSKYKPLASLLE